MAITTIADIDVAGKRVLMRVDFNVPIKNGEVTNDRRIRQTLPSIERLLDQEAKLILLSHCGRPAGTGYEAEFSNKPAADRLSVLLGKRVKLGEQDVGGQADLEAVTALKNGDLMLLENVRFNAGECMIDRVGKNLGKKLTPEQEAQRQAFAAALANLGEVYVNDAFGACAREHVTMYDLPKAIQAKGGPAVAGFLVGKEIKHLHTALSNPGRPFVAILGGAKVSDKIKLVSNLMGKVDRLLIGGAMAYTLLKAKGVSVGRGLVEGHQIEPMRELLANAGDKLMLPCDHVATDGFDAQAMRAGQPVPVEQVHIPDCLMGMDIGPKTVAAFANVIAEARTIVWNGPMGVFEIPDFAAGTMGIAESIAKATDAGAVSVIGGGDSAAAVEDLGMEKRMTHVSTGGGASLKYLEGTPMLSIEVLDKK